MQKTFFGGKYMMKILLIDVYLKYSLGITQIRFGQSCQKVSVALDFI